MMTRNLTVLALLGLVTAHNHVFETPANKEIRKNKFGAMEIIEQAESGINKLVYLPSKKYTRDYVQQAEYLQDASAMIQANREKALNGTLYTC